MKKGVNIKLITIFSVIFFHVRHLGAGGGGGGARWSDSVRHYSSEGEYKRIYSFHITIWWPSLIFSFYIMSFII